MTRAPPEAKARRSQAAIDRFGIEPLAGSSTPAGPDYDNAARDRGADACRVISFDASPRRALQFTSVRTSSTLASGSRRLTEHSKMTRPTSDENRRFENCADTKCGRLQLVVGTSKMVA